MESSDKRLSGYICAAVSAVGFSAKGVFAKFLYAYGVDPVTLLALRFSIAIPFFWLMVFMYPSERVSRRDMLLLVLSGLIGLYAAALADFYGLKFLDASIERIVIYTYPTIVIILGRVFFKEPFGIKRAAALFLTYAGLLFSLKVFEAKEAYIVGGSLVFFSAVIYSASYILTEVISRRVSGVKISAYTVTAAGAAFIATWHGSAVPEGFGPWALITALALFSTFIPVLTVSIAIKRIGAVRSAVIGFIGPVSTAVLSNVFLGERMDSGQVLGMALVLVGVLLITTGKDGGAERAGGGGGGGGV